jgi:hypothetical protein
VAREVQGGRENKGEVAQEKIPQIKLHKKMIEMCIMRMNSKACKKR